MLLWLLADPAVMMVHLNEDDRRDGNKAIRGQPLPSIKSDSSASQYSKFATRGSARY